MTLRSLPAACALLSLTALAACQSAARPRPIPLDTVARFGAPIALEAAGAAIDVTKVRGYAGPALLDDDRDGRLDLYVGSFSGQILRFHNVGTAQAPAFAKGELVRGAGEELKISNW